MTSLSTLPSAPAHSELAEECDSLLSDHGPFVDLVSGFRSRSEQRAMAQYVVWAIESGANLVVEAGTGVGKTFAYIVPAILSGKRVLISTGTRYLQDQIYLTDLPLVLEALGMATDVAVLKGRANYLCLERLQQAWQSRALDEQNDRLVASVYRWSQTTADGDISDFDEMGEDDALWQSLTSTSENCLRADCPRFDQCHVFKARERARQADVVIVNHYLLLADMSLKEQQVGGLLPDMDTIIVDEAHQLNAVADQFFSISFSGSQCMRFLCDLRLVGDQVKTPTLMNAAAELEDALRHMWRAFDKLPERSMTRDALEHDEVEAARRALAGALEQLAVLLKPLRVQSEQLSNLADQAATLHEQFNIVCSSDGDRIGWYQRGRSTFHLHATSLTETTQVFSDKYQLYNANWIYTSATLSLDGDFTYFLNQVSLDQNCTCVALDSPFDYAEQAALYVPENIPAPNDPGHTACVVDIGCRLLEMAQGGVFFLFTSHRALREAARRLADRSGYTLLVQGNAPKVELINRFRETPRTVLLGTAGFWGGVDVRGSGLRCVIIDRLPFDSPEDPLTKGRIRKAKEQGRNYFMERSLPEAVISLRQGVGRLIRDETDMGVVMIADKRLRTKSYGKIFLDSLPPMKHCGQLESLHLYLKQRPA